jgi:hypothetical protein
LNQSRTGDQCGFLTEAGTRCGVSSHLTGNDRSGTDYFGARDLHIHPRDRIGAGTDEIMLEVLGRSYGL